MRIVAGQFRFMHQRPALPKRRGSSSPATRVVMYSTIRRALAVSSLRSWVRAVSVYSIVQVKGMPHVGGGVHVLGAVTKALQNVCG